MADDTTGKLRLEIAHVLFIDIVGYSKLLINEQSEQLRTLKEIVRGTEQVRRAEAEGKLLRLPTGDGGALVFRTTPEVPVLCAIEVSKALKAYPDLKVRMGIHSGPVNEVTDLNEQANMAGAGINLAQRVMDAGDAGHILISKHVANDIDDYPEWHPYLHDLGDCEVKHGVRIGVVNVYNDEVGNPRLPNKLLSVQKRRVMRWSIAASAVAALFVVIAVLALLSRRTGRVMSSLPEKSIAVLPFANFSAEAENAYFADGVQDEILTDLAKIADLKVISRTSVMQYKTDAPRNVKEIGQQLGVAHLLEGSVQRAANKVRVNAQLIDARSDSHQWAQVYDRPLDDVFAIQTEIAKAIADQLRAKLSANEKAAIETQPTANLAAFDEYSRARTLLATTSLSPSMRKNYLQAVEILHNVITRDPTFFAAYCQLVEANDILYALGGASRTAARVADAEAALEAAARLRPEAPETHLARASHLYYALRDYNAALRELDLARPGLSNDPRVYALTAYILRRQERHEEGLRELEHATDLDPRNTFTLAQLAISYQNLFRWREKAAVLDRILAITPDAIEARTERAKIAYQWKGDTKPLHDVLAHIRAEQPLAVAEVAPDSFECALAERDWVMAEEAIAAIGDDPIWGDGPVRLSRQFGQGLLARAMHNDGKANEAFAAARKEQEELVAKQEDYGPALCVLALIDAGLGKKELALEEGQRAMELLPVESDSTNGQKMQIYFAVVASWVGEKDTALQQLASAGSTAGAALVANYGTLKLHPFWDALRGDARFEKLVTDKAP